MSWNKPKPLVANACEQNQNVPPPIPSRNLKPTTRKTESLPINLRNTYGINKSIPLISPIVREPSCTYSEDECTTQIEIVTEKEEEGRNAPKNIQLLNLAPKLPLHELNTKFNVNSDSVNEEVHRLKAAFKNSDVIVTSGKNLEPSALPLPRVVRVPSSTSFHSDVESSTQTEILEKNIADEGTSSKNVRSVDVAPDGSITALNENFHRLEEAFESTTSKGFSVKNRETQPRPPVVKELLSIRNSDVESTSQTKIIERKAEGRIFPKKSSKTPPLELNTKFNEKPMTIIEKAQKLDEAFKTTALRGSRQPLKDNEITINPTTMLSTEPTTTKEVSELSEEAPLVPRPLKRSSLAQKYKAIVDNLDKLSSNTETFLKDQNKFKDKFKNLKIPSKTSPIPLPRHNLPVYKAKENEEKPTNLSSDSKPFKVLTEQEPLYEELEDDKMEVESKDIPNASKNNKTNEIDSKRNSLPIISELIIGPKKTDCIRVLQADKNQFSTTADIEKPFKILPDKEKYSPELAFIITDMISKEINYIAQLQNALEILKELEKSVPQSTRHKLFGYFQEIQSFHKGEFLVELNRSETPKQFALCFVKHFLKFNLYIRKEWLFSSNLFDADSFDNLLIESRNLKPYVNLTTQRLSEYTRSLECFQSLCEKEKDLENRIAAEEAVKIVKNIEYQIQMVQQFKKLFGKASDEFKECGQVRLTKTFKITINRSCKKKLLVYLCENMIIFADTQNNDRYQCIDVIPTSQTFCCVLKQKYKFEVGIKGRNTFNLAAETQSIKDQWCRELKKLIKGELYKDM